MPVDEDLAKAERKSTDESLRTERERVDDALDQRLLAIDEAADAVIERVRTRTSDGLAERTKRALLNERNETDRDLSSERANSDAALATRDERLWIVSHDLRTALNHVIGFAQVAETAALKGNNTEQVVSYVRRIHKAGLRMNRMVGDLVDVASIESGKLAVFRDLRAPAEVVTEIAEAFQIQAAASRVSLKVAIVAPVPVASFDFARILQVLTNLVSNAIKFTPPQGTIELRLERKGGETHFEVSDTGPGIPGDMLEAVFERFLQVVDKDRRGLGLGLYISKCIIQGHGGRIWAVNNVERGATFHFTIPTDAPTAA